MVTTLYHYIRSAQAAVRSTQYEAIFIYIY